MILRNVEGLREWDIPPGWHAGRRPGLSAMIRLKNEAEWIETSLRSIEDWCDEIAICLQGEQTDGTDRIVADWAKGRRHVQVHHYPFDSVPNGPEHERQRRGSLHERAYFYNWCLARTTRAYALKWDGDMVALPGLDGEVRRHMADGAHWLSFRGVDLVALDPPTQSIRAYTASEPRLFRVRPETYYTTGTHTESFTIPNQKGPQLSQPGFLHFKWCKDRASATKAWPEDWRTCPHFQNVYRKRERGDLYRGPWPECIDARSQHRASG